MKIDYILIKRWYLEMDEAPDKPCSPAPDNIKIKPFDGSCEDYRSLNKLIGEDLGWVDRQIMSDDKLTSILNDPDIKIYVIYFRDEAIGYSELDFRDQHEVILEYFGIGPNYRGKRLGKFLLQWTIEEVWKYKPRKLKLHTSDRDHPNALPNYLKAGFKIVSEKTEKQAVIL